jgi:hypothetical protein
MVDVLHGGHWLEASVVQLVDGDPSKVVTRCWEHPPGAVVVVDKRSEVRPLHTHTDPWRDHLGAGSLLDVLTSRHDYVQRKSGGWRLCRVVSMAASPAGEGPTAHVELVACELGRRRLKQRTIATRLHSGSAARPGQRSNESAPPTGAVQGPVDEAGAPSHAATDAAPAAASTAPGGGPVATKRRRSVVERIKGLGIFSSDAGGAERERVFQAVRRRQSVQLGLGSVGDDGAGGGDTALLRCAAEFLGLSDGETATLRAAFETRFAAAGAPRAVPVQALCKHTGVAWTPFIGRVLAAVRPHEPAGGSRVTFGAFASLVGTLCLMDVVQLASLVHHVFLVKHGECGAATPDARDSQLQALLLSMSGLAEASAQRQRQHLRQAERSGLAAALLRPATAGSCASFQKLAQSMPYLCQQIMQLQTGLQQACFGPRFWARRNQLFAEARRQAVAVRK